MNNPIQQLCEKHGTNDLHRAVVAEALGIPVNNVTPAQRVAAKTALFAYLYSPTISENKPSPHRSGPHCVDR